MLNRLYPLGVLGVILWLLFWGLPRFRLTSLALVRPAADGVHAPFDDSWQAESYRAGKGSELGALGIRACAPLRPWLAERARLLRLDVDFNRTDLDKHQGECWFDVDTLGLGRVLDLGGGTVEARLLVPFALTSKDEKARVAGAQLIAESESTDGHRGRLYSRWEDFTNWWALETRSLAITGAPASDAAWKDADFNPLRIVRLGVKVALNRVARQPYQGSVIVTDFAIHRPTAASSSAEKDRLQVERRPPSDDETLAKLRPLQSTEPGRKRLSETHTLVPKTSSVRSLELVPEPGNSEHEVWKAELDFPFYEPTSAGRSARFAYPLQKTLDLRRKRLTAWAAVGPSLRGFAPRPNRIQFELVDELGRVLRGSVADVSAGGISFDSNAREVASNWIRFDVAPGNAGPRSLGFVDEAFDASRVREVGIRLLIGKFSNEFRLHPYPLTGRLLLSQVTVEDDTIEMESFPTIARRNPVEKRPVPIEQFRIGVNYGAGSRYGYNAGLYQFGGRNLCGFSAHRPKLVRDFTSLAEHGIRLVRIFLLDDLRSGVTLDQNGLATGLDQCVLRDVRALVETASASGVQLIVVMMDYLIADGVQAEKEFGGRRWSEGEHPHFITDLAARRPFLDKVIRPVVQEIAAANRDNGGGVIFAVDVANELENAAAVFQGGKFREVKIFVQDVLQVIRSTGLKTTFGSRNRNDLMRYWADLEGIDIFQFHHYDAMEEEDRQPLHFPAGQLGFPGPVIVGELEPSDIERKLETVWADGYSAVLFWAAQSAQDTQPLDGFRIDFGRIRKWLESKRSAR